MLSSYSGYDSKLGTANLVTRFDMMLLVLPNEELVLIFCISKWLTQPETALNHDSFSAVIYCFIRL